MRTLLVLLVSLFLFTGCAESKSNEPIGPRKIYSIKIYSDDAQIISEYKTYKSPFSRYMNTCALDYMTVRFVDTNGKSITIANGIIVIEEE